MPRKKIDPELEAAAEQKLVEEKEPVELTPKRSPPQTRSSDDILTINDQERGITPTDSDDVKWNYISGAYARKEILPVSSVVSNLLILRTPSALWISKVFAFWYLEEKCSWTIGL